MKDEKIFSLVVPSGSQSITWADEVQCFPFLQPGTTKSRRVLENSKQQPVAEQHVSFTDMTKQQCKPFGSQSIESSASFTERVVPSLVAHDRCFVLPYRNCQYPSLRANWTDHHNYWQRFRHKTMIQSTDSSTAQCNYWGLQASP